MIEPRTVADLTPGDTAYISSYSVLCVNTPKSDTDVYDECRPHSSVRVTVLEDGTLEIDREAFANLVSGGKVTRILRHDERAEVGRLVHLAIMALLDHNLALVRMYLDDIKTLVEGDDDANTKE